MNPSPPNDTGSGAPGLWLQVTALVLAALLPIFWLVGRRTGPPTRQEPVLFRAAEPPIDLQESARGLAANQAPVTLASPGGTAGVYRLLFVPGGSSGAGQPPYRVRLEAPDGRDVWETTWSGPGTEREAAELVLPAAGLRPGRYALLVQDAAGALRSFPFILP